MVPFTKLNSYRKCIQHAYHTKTLDIPVGCSLLLKKHRPYELSDKLIVSEPLGELCSIQQAGQRGVANGMDHRTQEYDKTGNGL